MLKGAYGTRSSLFNLSCEERPALPPLFQPIKNQCSTDYRLLSPLPTVPCVLYDVSDSHRRRKMTYYRLAFLNDSSPVKRAGQPGKKIKGCWLGELKAAPWKCFRRFYAWRIAAESWSLCRSNKDEF